MSYYTVMPRKGKSDDMRRGDINIAIDDQEQVQNLIQTNSPDACKSHPMKTETGSDRKNDIDKNYHKSNDRGRHLRRSPSDCFSSDDDSRCSRSRRKEKNSRKSDKKHSHRHSDRDRKRDGRKHRKRSSKSYYSSESDSYDHSSSSSDESDNNRRSGKFSERSRRSTSSNKKKKRKESSSRDHKKSSRKEKKHKKKKSKQDDNRYSDGSSSSDEEGVRRSVITGKKIKMHIDKDADDVAHERARRELLRYMNASI